MPEDPGSEPLISHHHDTHQVPVFDIDFQGSSCGSTSPTEALPCAKWRAKNGEGAPWLQSLSERVRYGLDRHRDEMADAVIAAHLSRVHAGEYTREAQASA